MGISLKLEKYPMKNGNKVFGSSITRSNCQNFINRFKIYGTSLYRGLWSLELRAAHVVCHTVVAECRVGDVVDTEYKVDSAFY